VSAMPAEHVSSVGGVACYLRDPDRVSIELLEEPPGGPDRTA